MRTRLQTNNRAAFEVFPNLPVEIRRMIWQATVKPRILPSKPVAELSVCREARQFLLEIYELCFQPAYQALVDYPISLYANFRTDILFVDSYAGNGEIWQGPWTEFLVPEALDKLKHLAIEEQNWRDMDPEDGMARLESGEDARWQIADFTCLEELSLVIARDLDSPYCVPDHDPPFDLRLEDWLEKSFDERRLVRSAGFDWPDDELANEAWTLLEDLQEDREGWKAPDVQLARIVR